MVTVLLADDHPLVRTSILRILHSDPTVEVVGEASDFDETLAKAHKTRPDVLILDLHMPCDPGFSINEICAQLSCYRVLGISFANDDDARAVAASIGAIELLDKIKLVKELIPSIMRIAALRTVPSKTRNESELG
jgi:DNA-binding NarL/FixJ family response regulator